MAFDVTFVLRPPTLTVGSNVGFTSNVVELRVTVLMSDEGESKVDCVLHLDISLSLIHI